MSRRLVLVLAAVLTLVVPLQGMAARLGGLCPGLGLGHHDLAAKTAPAVHAAHHGHGHASSEQAHDEAPAQAQDDDPPAHCAPCAACCGSASIVSSPSVVVASLPVVSVFTYSGIPPPAVAPESLDRPPLSL